MSTVKVRIAVVIGPEGCWAAVGWGNPSRTADPDRIVSYARNLNEDYGIPTDALHWVTADVPIPAADRVIEGQVETGGDT